MIAKYFNQSQSTLHCQQATTVVPKRQSLLWHSFMLVVVSNKAFVLFAKTHSCSGQINTKKAIKKIRFELEITEHTGAFVCRSHLYLSDQRQHQKRVSVSQNSSSIQGVIVISVEQRQFTLRRHSSSTPVWTLSHLGNILLNGFMTVVCG